MDVRHDNVWLLIDPDVWIWPSRSRRDAKEFLDQRRRDRFNRKYDRLLSAWLQIILGTDQSGAEIELKLSTGPGSAGNPDFLVGGQTAFAGRLIS